MANFYQSVPKPQEVEVLCLHEALKWLQGEGHTYATIQADYKLVADGVNKKSPPRNSLAFC